MPTTPTPTTVRCPRCPAVLFVELSEGRYEFRHKGRTWRVLGTIELVECAGCRYVWSPTDALPRPATDA